MLVRSMTLCRTRQPTIFSRRHAASPGSSSNRWSRSALSIAPLQLGNTFKRRAGDQRLSARQVCVLQLRREIREASVVRYFDLCTSGQYDKRPSGRGGWVPVLPAQARAPERSRTLPLSSAPGVASTLHFQRLRTPRLTQPAGGRSQTNALVGSPTRVVARQFATDRTRRLAFDPSIMARRLLANLFDLVLRGQTPPRLQGRRTGAILEDESSSRIRRSECAPAPASSPGASRR